MKNTLLFFVFIFGSASSFAQDWMSVNPYQKTYFRSGDIFKYIISESQVANGVGDTTYFFHKTIRDSALWSTIVPVTNDGCLDTLAPSWLGRALRRIDSNGVELYKNFQDDSIVIKTQATIGDSWTMMNDNMGNSIVATITKIDTINIDGILDSVKEISTQRWNNSTMVTAYYNSYKFQLSKSKGWIAITDLYSLSIKEPKIIPNNNSFVYNSNEVFMRIPAVLGNTIRLNVDLDAKFQAGNEWIYYYEDIYNVGKNFSWVHDSIINAIPLGNHKYLCTIRRRQNSKLIGPPLGLQVVTNSDTTMQIIADSFYTCLPFYSMPKREQGFNEFILPEKANLFETKTNYKLESVLHNAYQVRSDYISQSISSINGSCARVLFSISGGTVVDEEIFNSKIGTTYYKFGYADVPGFYLPYYFTLRYADINGEIYGSKINVNALSVSEDEKLNLQIVPNPAKDFISIAGINSNALINISCFSTDGKLIFQKNVLSGNSLDISQLNAGMYFLKLQVGELYSYQKLIKD